MYVYLSESASDSYLLPSNIIDKHILYFFQFFLMIPLMLIESKKRELCYHENNWHNKNLKQFLRKLYICFILI